MYVSQFHKRHELDCLQCYNVAQWQNYPNAHQSWKRWINGDIVTLYNNSTEGAITTNTSNSIGESHKQYWMKGTRHWQVGTVWFHLHEVQKQGEKCCVVFGVRMMVTLRNRERDKPRDKISLPWWLSGKESFYQCWMAESPDAGLIPGLGRSHGEGNGSPLQYSCLWNSMDKWVWQSAVLGVA